MNRAALIQATEALTQIDGRTNSQRLIDELFPISF